MSAPAHAAMRAGADVELRVDAERARAPRGSRLDEARAWLRSALAGATGEGLLALTVATRVAPIEAPLRAVRKGASWAFAPADGVSIAAIGSTRTFTLSGENRLAAARVQCVETMSNVTVRAEDGALSIPLRAMIGLAFAPGSARETPWESFGDGAIVVPRWTYVTDGLRASLTLAVDRARPVDERLAIAELETLVAAIEAEPRAPGAAPPIVRVDHLDRERWDRAIGSIAEILGRGEARKIVASRRSVVTTATDLDPLDVLTRLEDARATSTRFLVRRGRASFVGSTPEHLFVQRGTRIETEALAGSIAAGADRAAERLLESAKDREEHELVVRHIVDRLGPLCGRIARPEAPQIRGLPTVLHLRTPIEAELSRPTHAIDVIAALHPTPAVGGTPADRALEWITRHEPAPRGWYGAPLGWIDARGDAEMLVALRCGVIQGGRAWLYAGCGVVAGSQAASEWDETTLKMRPMLRAIGAPA